MLFFSRFLIAFGLLGSTIASPAYVTQQSKRQDINALSQLGNIIGAVDPVLGATVTAAVNDILSGVGDDAVEGALIFSAILTAIQDTLAAQVTTPADIPQALLSTNWQLAASTNEFLTILIALSQIFASTTADLYEQIILLIQNGFGPTLAQELVTLITASFSGENSETNDNPDPPQPVYPQKSCLDAPYSLTEEQLRQVIYIPSGFTHGTIPPVIVSLKSLMWVHILLADDCLSSLSLAQVIRDTKPLLETIFRCYKVLHLQIQYGSTYLFNCSGMLR
jgi:MFS family permease